MVFRPDHGRGGSVSKKPKKKRSSKGYNPYAGGIDVNSIKRMGKKEPYESPYKYGAPRAVRNAPAEAKARNDARNSRPQRVAPQVTLRPKHENRAGEDRPSGQGGGSPTDVLDQLVQSMLTDSASQSFDYESALRQSTNAIRQAYGAEINAIRSNNRAATRATRRDRKEVEAMYAGLAASYGQQANESLQQGSVAAKEQIGLANQANKTIGENQRKNTAEEAKMLKDLGIEETADQIIAPDFKETTKVQAENTSRGARKASLQKEFASADSQYFNRGGSAARLEGTNRSADLLANLQDYIRQNRDQIGVIAGKRAQDVALNKQKP